GVGFGVGRVPPSLRRRDDAYVATAGPDAIAVRVPVAAVDDDTATVSTFEVGPGGRVGVTLTWYASHVPRPTPVEPVDALRETEAFWREWSSRCSYTGPHRDAVLGSLAVPKGLTFRPTGGIVAAPTTSLPEWPGGERNWDYRYCWLRDGTMMLLALIHAGYREEASEWRAWLVRAAAGDPDEVQVMYGVAGERRLHEWVVDWLPGFEGSRPVRIGNDPAEQEQVRDNGRGMDAILP